MVTAKLSCKVNGAAHVGYRDNAEILTLSVLIRVIDDLETGPRVQVSERTIKAQLAAHRHVMAGFAAEQKASSVRCCAHCNIWTTGRIGVACRTANPACLYCHSPVHTRHVRCH